VLIAGPTASGKSALALDVAKWAGGVVINADSMQVYRDLRIITARPTQQVEAEAPHQLYGHIDAAENYSVGHWLAHAKEALREADDAGAMPIFVGGTGLYFKALTVGLSTIPATPAEVRTEVRARLLREGPQALHTELARRDPPSASRLMPGDRARIARALEVLEATGRSITDWQRAGMQPLLDAARATRIFLVPDRAELYRRIDSRFDAMLGAGALDEVATLAARGLDPLLPAMKAHGVPWLRRHLAGELSLADAAAEAKMDTRRYAKRQVTWFRHQMPGWIWASPEEAAAAIERDCAERDSA
jgi:tRNA dimethylallyltransferase